jgi:hypothetical protein
MNRKHLLRLAAILACTAIPALSQAECVSADRNAVYAGKPTPFYLSKGTWSLVIFPENLRTILLEKQAGVMYREGVFHDRLYFTVTDPLYFGNVTFEGADGKTYELALLARDGCPDTKLTVSDSAQSSKEPPPTPLAGTGHEKTLIEYMWNGETPPDYTVETVQGTPEQRLVYSQGLGTVQFYLDKIYHGYNYTGFVLLAVNPGRSPVRVDIQNIDFSGEAIRKVFGRVKQITMDPASFRLGPAPEYASDAAQPKNQGIIYIVSYNRTELGGE